MLARSQSTIAAVRQNEMNVNITLVTTSTWPAFSDFRFEAGEMALRNEGASEGVSEGIGQVISGNHGRKHLFSRRSLSERRMVAQDGSRDNRALSTIDPGTILRNARSDRHLHALAGDQPTTQVDSKMDS